MKIWRRLGVFLLAGFVIADISVFAADTKNFRTTPTTNNGKRWRIAYYQGGQYKDYQKSLVAIVRGLIELGWITTMEIPPQQGDQTKDFWNWLATNTKSDYLEFVKDAHYNADWDKDLRAKTAAEIIQRLNQTKDIDLMIAAGTWAGQDLANNQHQTLTVIISSSDPLSAGIIKSVEDSGYDHIHARIDPFRYKRQVRLFHKIIGFRKLGIAYEDTIDGKSYAAISDVEEVANEIGFEIVRCHTTHDDADPKIAEESVKACLHELGKSADAIYLTVHPFVTNPKSIEEWVNIANSYRIPTFSQSGSEEVKQGFLMSISIADFKYVGYFWAETIARVLNGVKPRQLEQIFENPPKIAINLKTAEAIEYFPPVDVLKVADEIYQERMVLE
jgi:ABC-type uncharacterized transport system substrate-binding protein